MRPNRNKIKFTEDSLNDLFQEIYNDSYNLRTDVNSYINLIKEKLKNKEDIDLAIYTKDITQLLQLREKNNNTKLTLLKLLKDVVLPSNNGKDNSESNKSEITEDNVSRVLSAEEKQNLIKDIQKFR